MPRRSAKLYPLSKVVAGGSSRVPYYWDCPGKRLLNVICPYWKGFSHNDLKIMAKEMTFLKVGDGTSILKQGESASFVAFLATGSADVIIGEDKVVASIEAGRSSGSWRCSTRGCGWRASAARTRARWWGS